MPVDGVGFAPASPHEGTAKAGATIRCRQCHVFAAGDDLFVASEFVGLEQDLRRGGRATPGAPPTIPHRTLMRENCVACHDGPGAREEIRTNHPERWRCRQCHVPVTTRDAFSSALGQGVAGAE
jgi:cytochrome c-type protein NapB